MDSILLRAEEAAGLAAEAVGSAAEATGDAIDVGICRKALSGCMLQKPADCAIESCESMFTVLIFPFLALAIGTVSQPLSRIIRAPYTLILLLVGIALGLFGCGLNLGLLSTSLRQWVHLRPPQVFFYIFLAPLIFEAAFKTQWHIFRKLLIPILTAAFVIVILQTGLIAGFQKLVVRTDDWTWWSALMFGSMLSATDPISVTATLKAVGASEFLNTLIEGESLVNDGSAFVLWEAFFENAHDGGENHEMLSVGEIVRDIFRLSLGGMLMGAAFALVALLMLGFLYDEFEVETTVTVIVAFLGFWTAQAPSRLSGVICNVASGLMLSAYGRPLITPVVRGPLGEFWELLGWVANTVVFVHAGVLVSAFAWSCSGDPHGVADYLYIPGYFAFLQVIRIGLMFIFMPVMSWRNKWLTWKETLVVGSSGLRGAVSLILALEVGTADAIPGNVRSRVVLWTTGIVALSLLVNGLAIKPLLHLLKLDKADKAREEFLHRARSVMIHRTLMILDSLCIEAGFKAARWSYVSENVLPREWLEEGKETAGYAHAMDQMMDNKNTQLRRSLDLVQNEKRQEIMYTELNHRLSKDPHGLPLSPGGSSRALEIPGSRRMTMGSPRPSSPLAGAAGWNTAFNYGGNPSEFGGDPGMMNQLSLGYAGTRNPTFGSFSMDGFARRSIDADIERYQENRAPPPLTHAQIHMEVRELHRALAAGEDLPGATDKDREVRRRLLTSILSHVRAISNATLVEFSALVNLEEDVQHAIDANDEKEEYNLFEFLGHRDGHVGAWYNRVVLRVTEAKKLRGETSIVTASVVFGILTEILKENILEASPLVLLEAEQLYEGTAALLNRLEALNPFAFAWVQTQFAVHVTARKQDAVLEDLRGSGVVDEHEYETLHEELVAVRRRHALYTSRSITNQFPPLPMPRELIKNHPLFVSLPINIRHEVVDRYGVLVHLKGGQPLKAEKGSLVLVLQGAIRPNNEVLVPDHSVEGKLAATDSSDASTMASTKPSSDDQKGGQSKMQRCDSKSGCGATMHWCFSTHNAFCGSATTISTHNVIDGPSSAVAHRLTGETQYICCESAGSATVFTLPVAQVKRLALASEAFRTEITRSLTRQIVLDSIADQPPYALAHGPDALSRKEDEQSVIGRAIRTIERLPYMTTIRLHAGEQSTRHLQGPGVLLNGTVRVSIVDTSGLLGAVNLLHEQLTGPALLPAGGLIIQEVHTPDGDINSENVRREGDESKEEGLATIPEALELSKSDSSHDTDGEGDGQGEVLAHVFVEEVHDLEIIARRRLERWTGGNVDMNGRFAINRHVDLGREAWVPPRSS